MAITLEPVNRTGAFLVGSAKGEIFEASIDKSGDKASLPVRMSYFKPCSRRELTTLRASSNGKSTKRMPCQSVSISVDSVIVEVHVLTRTWN